MKWIIATGNPSDGFIYVGPFNSPEKATAYAEDEDMHDWWLVQLNTPIKV